MQNFSLIVFLERQHAVESFDCSCDGSESNCLTNYTGSGMNYLQSAIYSYLYIYCNLRLAYSNITHQSHILFVIVCIAPFFMKCTIGLQVRTIQLRTINSNRSQSENQKSANWLFSDFKFRVIKSNIHKYRHSECTNNLHCCLIMLVNILLQ